MIPKGRTLAGWPKKMLELGAVEAINLDGGGTVCLVFMGELINKKSASRDVSSLIAFGTAE